MLRIYRCQGDICVMFGNEEKESENCVVGLWFIMTKYSFYKI